MERKRIKTKQYNGELRNKVAKIRINDTEFEEFDRASKLIDVDKTEIIREAVKEYLAQREIYIWNN